MSTKRSISILAVLTIIVIIFTCSSCLPRRRWYSTYTDEKGVVKTEHYNQYKIKWYKRNWYNRRMWK